MSDYRPLIICQTCREPTRHSHARDHVIRVNAKAVSVQHHYACGTCGTLRRLRPLGGRCGCGQGGSVSIIIGFVITCLIAALLGLAIEGVGRAVTRWCGGGA